MKGTLIGTDYLEKDDSVKILEINTNTTIFNSGADLLDYDAFFSVLTENNITELHFIYTLFSSHLPTYTDVYRFEEILVEKCLLHNIQYFQYTVPKSSVTVPFIEDAPHKFILRQSYDTTAILDEMYCADKFGFLDLMKDTDLTPKSFFQDGVLSGDTLSNITLTEAGVPNIIVKERRPVYDVNLYPEIHELENNDDLNNLKSSASNSKLVQEYIYDEANIVDNRLAVIRSIDIFYGPNLDVVNLGGYKQSTIVDMDFCENEFEENTKKYNRKTRYKYINKNNSNSKEYEITYHIDSESNIIMGDGELRNIQNISLGDTIKSMSFTDLNGLSASAKGDILEGWDGTFDKTLETLSYNDTIVNHMMSNDVKTFFVRVTLENGLSWVDSPNSILYIEEKDSVDTKFEMTNKLFIGDKVILRNNNTDMLIKSAVIDLSIEYIEQTVYELDVEPYDLYLTHISGEFYAIMHNNCSGCGGSWCGNWLCYNFCSVCGGGEQIK